jgi:putative membrane protein
MLAHAGEAVAPQDLWSAWNLHPLPVVALLLGGWAYRRGMAGRRLRRPEAWRARCFAGALVATALALVSPLDALSGRLASAHMVQHVLLVLVAAPLLVLGAPSAVLLHASPPGLRRMAGGWHRRHRRITKRLGELNTPTTVWLLHVATLWFWHAAAPYDAAVANQPLHVLEHVSFVVTGFLFWRVVIGARPERHVSEGFGVLLVFAMAMQSVFLSALLTFASTPWYSSYRTTTTAWGFDALADQRLAGAIMWVPAGVVYLAAALALLTAWMRSSEREGEDAEGHADLLLP